jgi:DNA-binding MarR family transcriptional regulator
MQTPVPQLSEPAAAAQTAEDAVMGLMMAFGRRMRQRQPGDEIDFSSLPLLKLLSHQGPMRLSALAQALGLDASTVSRHVRQLEDRGMLQRTEDPDDRRASRVAVSERGSDCLGTAFEARRHLITVALQEFTGPDREALRKLLNRLVDQLSAPITH